MLRYIQVVICVIIWTNLVGCAPDGSLSLPSWVTNSSHVAMDRENWLDFDPASTENSVQSAIASSGRVNVYGRDVVAATNRVLTVPVERKEFTNLVQLGPTYPSIPIEEVRIKREIGSVQGAVLFSTTASIDVKAAIASGNVKGLRFYTCKANLVRYSATYIISITDLFREGLIGERSNGFKNVPDLNGLPKNYFTFDTLESRVAFSGNANVEAGLLFAGIKAGTENEVNSGIGFSNKVFAVEFLRASSGSVPFQILEQPITYERVSLSGPSRTQADVLDALRDMVRRGGLVERSEVMFVIRDARSKSQYTVARRWFANPDNASVDITITNVSPEMGVYFDKYLHDGIVDCERTSYNGALSDIIRGNVFPDDPNNSAKPGTLTGATIIPYVAGFETDSPYEGRWVYYEPGVALHFVDIADEWKALRSFVTFVK